MLVKLSATVSDTTSTVLTGTGNSSNNNTSLGLGGTIIDVRIISSADTSVSVVISDATGPVFTIGSADYTTATLYKNDNAAIVRNSVTGQLSVVATGIGSGTFTVNVWVKV